MRTIKAVVTFLFGGLCVGCCFGWLISTPRLTSFWYRKGDKFLIPTYRYYLGFSLLLLLGLTLGYLTSRMNGWIENPPESAVLRAIAGSLIVALSAPALYALPFIAPSVFDSPEWLLIASIAFVLLISVACWILTSKFYYSGVLLNLLTLPVTFAFLYLLAKLRILTNDSSGILTYSTFESLLAASCGFWLARQSYNRSNLSPA